MSNARNLARLLPNASGQLPPANVQKLLNSNMPSGTVLQVVQSVKTGTAISTSTSYIDLTGLSATITPLNASSKIMVIADVKGNANIQTYINTRLLRNGVQIYGGDGTYPNLSYGYTTSGDGENRYSVRQLGGTYIDSPATTSPVTYSIQAKTPDGGEWYINRSEYSDSFTGTSASSITLLEIAP